MFFFTLFAGVTIAVFITWYTKFTRKLMCDYESDEDISYGKHPMSDSDDDDEIEDEDEDDIDKDFYDESVFPKDWFLKSDKEKKEILDKELDEYMKLKKN